MATDRSTNQPASEQPVAENKVISPAIRKRLQRCFERGSELARLEKADHDYAHTMFSECVLNDPGNLEYVEAMLSNLQRKYKNNKRGARLKGFGGRGVFKKAVASEDWEEVLRMGMDLLKTNPWDVTALRGLANACKANHYNEVELRYLKNALDVNSKDIEVNKHCAESLARMGQFDQAIVCWHRIEELDKGNVEAKKKMSELTLAKQLGGTLPEAASSSTAKQPGKPADTPAKSAPVPAKSSKTVEDSTPSVETLEQALAKDAGNLDHYVQLAQIHTENQRFREAYQTLKKALEASGGRNLQIQQRMEEAQIRMIRSQVVIAEQRAESEKTTEANDLVRRFRAELNRQELLIYNGRCFQVLQRSGQYGSPIERQFSNFWLCRLIRGAGLVTFHCVSIPFEMLKTLSHLQSGRSPQIRIIASHFECLNRFSKIPIPPKPHTELRT